MGLLLDIVPNHMGIGPDNVWWMDVLKHGPASPYAEYFDIDWRSPKRELENQVLLPVLADHYGKVLESGGFRLAYEGDEFWLYYGSFRMPIAIGTCASVVRFCYQLLIEQIPATHDAALELQSLITALRHLPSYTDLAPESVDERLREQIVIRRRLSVLHQNYAEVRQALDETIALFNGTPDEAESYDLLDDLIAQQPYRLAYWRVAGDEINYRRFFDINDMAAIRPEQSHVFEAVHGLAMKLLQDGKINGLRVDHPDGLWDPPAYFLQLQESYVQARAAALSTSKSVQDAVGGTFVSRFVQGNRMPEQRPLYVVVEKILSEIEPLPEDWAVDGTTGYDFMIAVNGIFVNRDHVHAFDKLYSNFVGQQFDFRELIYQTKKLIMRYSLASEINSRSQRLAQIVERNRRLRGFTLNGLTFALTEMIACMSIYRTYITRLGMVSERDQHYIEAAIQQAKQRNPRTPAHVFDFVRDTLLLKNIYEFEEEHRADLIEFVMQFQQITGPVMAKSVEDTVFYIYNRLVSLNEVGGNPEQFGIGVDDFHRHNDWHQEHWPHTLIALSTHDTKRSEDVRARINVLSEIPEEWEAAIWRWSEMNADAKTEVDGSAAPDRNDEYLIYQTLIGTWPMKSDTWDLYVERIASYMHKAIHEAKVHTSWTNTYEPYSRAVDNFVRRILEHVPFVSDMALFQERTSYYGHFNSLAQTLLKITSPGVSDTYQGTELWDFSLVDPDNRRPVDYDRRRVLLSELRKTAKNDRNRLIQELLENAWDGLIKLYTMMEALNFRREYSDLFTEGDYIPLEAVGEKARHVCGFMRAHEQKRIIAVVPVLVVALTEGQQRLPLTGDVWKSTHLLLPDTTSGQQYRNVFTGQMLHSRDEKGQVSLPLGAIFSQFPVALLEEI